ncbi:MAG: 4-hydroxy-tetrahydrodipicolinate synthase [candidate division WOR-3 bacterium]|nr:MAG: 4-hydroxy-tetrahydrodipicolinate synthase [candidate division WOR-3 bacterium]
MTRLQGTYTLLVTPFKDDLSLDEEGLRVLVQRQVKADVHGIAPLGVTGENSLLSEQEIIRIMEIIVEEVNGRCKVIPDTCTSSIDTTLERIKLYDKIGSDYVSVFVPFLVLPKEDGIISFYEKIADDSKLPILIHNSPGRVVVNLSPEGVAHLARHPNIAGIKEGVKGLDHLAKIIYLTKDEDFSVFTGKDTTLYPLLSFGGHGNFAVAGNIVPEVMKNIFEYHAHGEDEKARELHYSYYDLFEGLRSETNPIPAKEALNMMGLPGGYLRPPLTRLSEQKREKLKKILKNRKLV